MTDTSGPAFPHLGLYQGADGNMHPTPTQYTGLTKREYFAAMAMQGMLAYDGYAAPLRDDKTTAEIFADSAVEIADALLAALGDDT